jgi:hypothetical protein
MSEALDQETKRQGEAINQLLIRAYHLAERGRLQTVYCPVPAGGILLLGDEDDRHYEVVYLKPNFFAVSISNASESKYPGSFTIHALNRCQAWIFHYNRHYAKWSVEAWNAETGNRSFSKLARRLTTD